MALGKNSVAVNRAMSRLQDLKADRSRHEMEWRQIAEFMAPQRTFDLNYGPPAIRRRTLVDTTGVTFARRLAALLQGMMISPYQQWVQFDLKAREARPDEHLYFEMAAEGVHTDLIAPEVGFTSAALESLLDDVTFGNSVMWGGRNRPGGPVVWQAQPLAEHYWCENADGMIDTDYREFTLPLKRAADAFRSEKLLEKVRQNASMTERHRFVHVVEPTQPDHPSGFRTNKAYTSIVYSVDTDEIVREGGFDSFPYAITRFERRAGDAYGTGPGWDALPLCRLLNQILETNVRAAELAADPPLINFAGPLPQLDRRPGGMTNVDAAFRASMMNSRDLIRRLYEGGDPSQNIELIRDLRERIAFLFFIDWMSIGQNQQMSATEVLERRDIRLGAMTPVVSRMENEKLTRVVERHYSLIQDNLVRPPDSLDGEEVVIRFASPLARAQKQTEVERYMRTVAMLERGATIDETILDVVDLQALTREALMDGGTSRKGIRSPEDVEARQRQRAEAEAQEQQLMAAQAAAGAARDAGQAMASIAPPGQAA